MNVQTPMPTIGGEAIALGCHVAGAGLAFGSLIFGVASAGLHWGGDALGWVARQLDYGATAAYANAQAARGYAVDTLEAELQAKEPEKETEYAKWRESQL